MQSQLNGKSTLQQEEHLSTTVDICGGERLHSLSSSYDSWSKMRILEGRTPLCWKSTKLKDCSSDATKLTKNTTEKVHQHASDQTLAEYRVQSLPSKGCLELSTLSSLPLSAVEIILVFHCNLFVRIAIAGSGWRLAALKGIVDVIMGKRKVSEHGKAHIECKSMMPPLQQKHGEKWTELVW